MQRSHNTFYGQGLPYLDMSDLSGRLIVIEGTDGVGRSTHIESIDSLGRLAQIEDLTKWLEVKGHSVVNTGWTRSPLLGPAIDTIERGNTSVANISFVTTFFLAL